MLPSLNSLFLEKQEIAALLLTRVVLHANQTQTQTHTHADIHTDDVHDLHGIFQRYIIISNHRYAIQCSSMHLPRCFVWIFFTQLSHSRWLRCHCYSSLVCSVFFLLFYVAFLIGEIPQVENVYIARLLARHTTVDSKETISEHFFFYRCELVAHKMCTLCSACSDARIMKIALITIQFVFYWHPLTCIPFHIIFSQRGFNCVVLLRSCSCLI